jgi:YfiH family protein
MRAPRVPRAPTSDDEAQLMSVDWLVPAWQAPSLVRAAFSWRTGGVSVGPYASLNLATHVGDAPAAVDENRALLRAALRLPSEPRWLQQVHGTAVVDCDRDRDLNRDLNRVVATVMAAPPVADAAVTRRAGRVLAIMVADCLPVLYASDDGTVVAAAHAGWRGLASGVLEATVLAMAAPAAELQAWFGPAIRQPHFEVGDEVRSAFLLAAIDSAERAATAAAFAANTRGRWQCDLSALARLRLRRVGITRIVDSGVCTYADATRCHSHRRDGQTGRMAALVWLQP